MKSLPSFNSYIEQSILNNWDKDALTDYKGVTLQYHDVARKIEKLHILFEESGIGKGDKIALFGRNSSHWAVAFLATVTYGAVVVPIQHEFTPEQVYNIVNHSESKLLFVGDFAAPQIDFDSMPELGGIIYLPDFSIIAHRTDKLTYAREHLNEIFGQKYPKYFRKEHVSYHRDANEELAMINYTSGTTGYSKGVMIPYRALVSNVDYITQVIGSKLDKDNRNVLSILPMAHMYGLLVEFLFEFCFGNHIYFLTRLPSPSFIAEACTEIKPAILVSVPLIVEKIIRKKIFPIFQTHRVKFLLNIPVLNKKLKEHLVDMVKAEFGGKIYEIMVGGAPLNKEIEKFLTDIGFPITMGYGTTETAPMITYSDWRDFVAGSCGTPALNMEVRIHDENNPESKEGEVITKGTNVMLGYYKNEEATKAVIDEAGWFHTGDLGMMSEDGHVFIRGRIKNMLLGSNGQNIYPEEIEDKLNSMTMVSESLVIQEGEKLVGLVYPDHDEVDSLELNENDLTEIMEQNRLDLNQLLPHFAQLSAIRIHDKEFEKTPKKSIKRYLYQSKK